MRQHNLQPGDCVAIKRTFNDALHIVINPDSPADGREVRHACIPLHIGLLLIRPSRPAT